MIASLSLDLDNLWSYMKTHGDSGWEDFPSYLDTVVPRILDVLEKRNLSITFFVVGQDAALDKNHSAITSITKAGHEIGNHSFNHDPWLHLFSKKEIEAEVSQTEEALERITGKRPVGFRGPGFSLSPTVLEVLTERGYEYDCSSLPTYIAPLARAYYFLKSPDITREDREKLKKLFGKFSDGFRSLKPHLLENTASIVEIPVTTFPIVKTPLHLSYLMFLFSYSPTAARMYWKSAMTAFKLTKTQPSLLLHPLDFLSGEDVNALRFFPGMGISTARKLEFLDYVLDSYCSNFTVVTMKEHADAARKLWNPSMAQLKPEASI